MHNIAENNFNRTTTELDLCILVTHYWNFSKSKGIILPKIIRPDPNSNSTCVSSWLIYIPNFNSKCRFVMEITSGNWKLMKFSNFKGHNSAENYSTRPKFELNLRILKTHLYTEFQFKMSICNGDIERKLKIYGIFLSPRGITLPKIIRPDPNLNSTCVFPWQTYVANFIRKSPCMTEIMSGNWIRNDGMMEGWNEGMTERGNTICPGHFMAGALK